MDRLASPISQPPAFTPPPPPSPPSQRLFRGLLLGVLALIAALLGAMLLRPSDPLLPAASTSRTEVRPTPNVLLAVRELARLETINFHMERVVDLADEQTHLFGIVRSRDMILLVAVGDVIGGVDLQKLRDEDVTVDWTKRHVTLRLPPAEVFTTTLDHDQTRVYLRKTDTFASRHEDLEERARREATKSMERAAVEGGLLDRAQQGAERAIRSLLRSTGFEEVDITWRKE